MEERGIQVLYGRWLIEGAPRVLLIDTKTGYRFLDEWKADLWNVAGIPSPPGDDETNEAIVFGYLVAWFLGEVSYIPAKLRYSLMLCSSSHMRRPEL
jgi:glycogen(starch) synthase